MRTAFQSILPLLCLWTGLASAQAQPQPVPAGTQIVNQATGNYKDLLAGDQTSQSNIVKTSISPVCSVSVLASTQALGYQPGRPLAFAFTVSNNGNDRYSFGLQGKTTPPLGAVRLYRDAAPLSIRDAGDALLTAPEQLSLNAGEAQSLLLEVDVPANASGQISGLLSAACPNGGTATTGQQTARPGAQLELSKSFSAAAVQPNGDVTVTLRAVNTGDFDAQNVIVEDLFEQSLNAGNKNFELVAGSAAPTLGYEQVAAGVRWRVPLLARQQALSFSFRLRALPGAKVGQQINQAAAQGQDAQGNALPTAQAQATIAVRPPPQIALGPAKNAQAAPGGEGSASDRQSQSDILQNQEVCFEHELQNLGPDTDNLSVAAQAGAPNAVFRTLGGAAQVFPVTLAPNQTAAFLACYRAAGNQPFEARLTATSTAQAQSNSTIDAVVSFVVPGVALGPVNAPEAPELSETDTQSQPLALVGKPNCFQQTLKNTGTNPDSYTISASQVQGAATTEIKAEQPLNLAPGASVTFTVCFTPLQPGTLEVLLTATSKYGPTNLTRDRVLNVVLPQIALGPIGNPQANPGGEGSADDLQVRDNGLLNQRLCFSQTVSNLAAVPDQLSIGGVIDLGTAELTLENLDGSPLVQPVALTSAGQSGDHLDFRVCVTPSASASGAAALQLTLKATSALGAASNATRDQVLSLYSGLPRLTKVVDQASGTPVAQGQRLTYSLKSENPFPFALAQITVQDTLSDYLDPATLEISDGGRLEGKTVIWTLDHLDPQSARTLTVSAKVKQDAPDGVLVVNRFVFSSREVQTPTPSNEVESLIWSATLTLDKRSDSAQVDIGGELGWTLHIHNTSKSAVLIDLMLNDTLPTGLSFVPGSAKLDGEILTDPVIQGQLLHFNLPTPIKANATVTLTFRTRVGVDSPEIIINSAQVEGKGQDTLTAALTAVASNVARSQVVRINPRVFAPRGELLGRVYLDLNADAAFTFGKDLPLANARLILADGRSVLTDKEGRYHFQSLPEGMWGLRLDPNSVPFVPERDVNDGGLLGSRNMSVFALTVADFPLEKPQGDIYAERVTTLRVGSAVLSKSMLQMSLNTFQVTLSLQTPQALSQLHILDPLPTGASMTDGASELRLDVPAGQQQWRYTFEWSGKALPTLTDPQMDWRYP
ncbi:DUF11 domain-containing protein [Deinococcus detaillensis]|uniref:DUF11 domain-containing protein n=1 Tax=Deinococcus detaillensis TaxID=2592048 RepID=A0A553UU66_9DEIO|nr:DUF11 domain-containing protein [Deinococcus detaillensis]TSA83744.1 DUF11 domain-containing protein [Deinococcus detaillensis]